MINPLNQMFTSNLLHTMEEEGVARYKMYTDIIELFKTMPEETTDGGNDKHFFSATLNGIKIFAAENEIHGLTVMLPEDY